MDAQQFLAEFGHITKAPRGVTRLRALVLQLAISGRLTERVRGDVTADSLIAMNRRHQKTLIAKKELKRQPDPTGVSTDDQPWVLPDGWAWTRLGYITNYGDAPKVEPGDVDEDTWVLELEDVEKSTSRLLTKVVARDRLFKSTKNDFQAGAVLYGKLRPYLDKVLIAESPGVCTTEIIPISFFEHIEAGYLRWYLKSPYFVAYADGSTYGMNLPRLGTEAAREALFPFPPKQEQSLIVAKVDELMALCDQLEQQQQDRRKLQNALRKSTLQALASAQSPHELQTSWQRLHHNFGSLFVKPDDVDDLRQVVLDLAITGNLSEQTEMVAVEFLESLYLRKMRLSSEKRIKRETPVADFPGISEMLSQIPHQWVRVRLNDIASVVRGGSPRPAGDPAFYGGDIPFLKVADITAARGMYVENFTSTITEAGLSKTREITSRTVLLTNSGATLGVPAICEFRTTFNDGIAAFIELSDAVFDEYLYLFLKSKTKWLQDIASRGQGQPNLNTEIIRSMWFPLAPIDEQRRIVSCVSSLMNVCDALEAGLRSVMHTGQHFALAAVGALTGIDIERDEDTSVKAPKTQLIAPLRLGKAPSAKTEAPLARELARHNGEMSASDLWQRFGGEIDAFYAQLKHEVAQGWIREPEQADVQVVEA
jgi:type I restriction enzyme, S subunit